MSPAAAPSAHEQGHVTLVLFGMSRAFGTHQAALYAAEAESIDGLGITWGRLPAAQRYLNGLVSSPWFGERWPHFASATLERRGRGAVWSTAVALDRTGPGGTPTSGVILVAGALRQPVVLHELAHLLLPKHAGHGLDFADTLLTLVRREMGLPAFAELFEALVRREPFRALSAALGVSA